MMAGRDTVRLSSFRSAACAERNILQTAGLLTFVTYLLAIHPDVAKRLREEVLDVCGAAGNPTHDLIRKMPYSPSPFPPSLPPLAHATDRPSSDRRPERDPPPLPRRADGHPQLGPRGPPARRGRRRAALPPGRGAHHVAHAAPAPAHGPLGRGRTRVRSRALARPCAARARRRAAEYVRALPLGAASGESSLSLFLEWLVR